MHACNESIYVTFVTFRRYLVYADIAISAVTLFTLVWACLAVRRGGLVFALFFFDLVTTIIHFPIWYLIWILEIWTFWDGFGNVVQLATLTAMSAFSAATSEGYIGKYGNTHAGWLPICGYVHGYCNRGTLSLAFSFASFLLLFILTVLSASAARHHWDYFVYILYYTISKLQK